MNRNGGIVLNNYEGSNNKQKGFELNIIGYLFELSKKIWLILIIAIVFGLLGGIVGEVTSKDIYKSEVAFIVNTLSENEAVENSAVTAQINITNTFKYILSGRVLKEAVREKCEGNLSYAFIDSSITVETVESTNAIELTVKTEDAQTSYNIAKAVVDVYADVVEEIYPNATLNVCETPVKAQKPEDNRSVAILAVISAVIGVVIYCVFVLIMFIVKDTIKNSKELSDKLNIPVLGAVQFVSNKNKTTKGLLVADRRTGFSFIETYKAIRTKIESNSAKTGNKVYLVTSACENEGKTTVSANIALSLAENGRSVLLIDADLRKPSIAKILSIPETGEGFASVIKQEASITEAIKLIKNFNLYVLADNKPVSNPSELLSRRITEEIINSIRDEFDFIIIDTAPASVVTDASIIAGFADAAIVVVREDFSPFSRIRMSVEDIDSNGAEIVGCIFNAETETTIRAGKYGGKYGRYGGKYGRYGKYGTYGNYGYGYGATPKK